jgi:fructose/tagatose bisphosphate aldolase
VGPFALFRQARDDSWMLPSPEQYLEMLDGAAAGRYAFPAVNVTSSQTLNAAMRGMAEAESDGIVQVTVGGARYMSGLADNGLAGVRALAALGRELAAAIQSRLRSTPTTAHPEHVASFCGRCLRPRASEWTVATARCSTRICSMARRCRSRRTFGCPPSGSNGAGS